ncbi:MAG: translesion DNA synthesis-associated protein ImuA [Pseudomonadota bacterium]
MVAPPLSASTPVAARLAASARALAGIGVPVWQAGELARIKVATVSTGWPALDAELPGGGWPLAGLSELLFEHGASGELGLLAPCLRSLLQRELGSQELLWVAPPALPCVAALQALGLSPARLVCVQAARSADAAWAVEQALRAASCAAVLWWSGAPTSGAPTSGATWRRLHLAAQAGATPLLALRPLTARALSSPAPLRLACVPLADHRLAVEVFKRRGPPMATALELALPWPASARRPIGSRHDVVDRPAPAPVAAASPALV